MKKLLSLCVLFLMVSIVSCSKDDDNDGAEVDSGNGSVAATINGKDWKATTITSVTLTRIASLKAQRFDINVNDGSMMLLLAAESELTAVEGMPVRSYKFDETEDEETVAETTDDALFINTYMVGKNTYTEHFPRIGTITITSIDTAKKTISGTFNFISDKAGVLQTEIVTPDVFEVKGGVFTNLKYTVINL